MDSDTQVVMDNDSRDDRNIDPTGSVTGERTAIKVGCIVNPTAGWGRGLQIGRRLESVLLEMGLPHELHWTAPSQHAGAPELARRLLGSGCDCLAAVGGDGTFSQVASVVATSPSPVPVALVPAGTGNAMARALRMRNAPGWLRQLFRAPDTITVDAALIGDRMSFAVAGVGFDAQIVRALRRTAILPRLAGWAAAGVTQLDKLRPFRLRLVPVDAADRPGANLHIIDQPALCLAICNGPYYGGGLHMAPGADPADGALDYCLIGDVPLPEIPSLAASLLLGRHGLHPAVRMWRTGARYLVETDPAAPWHYDGEPGGVTPTTVGIRPASLRVLVPSRRQAGCP
jgi:diacylglycerol kinase (ATP)